MLGDFGTNGNALFSFAMIFEIELFESSWIIGHIIMVTGLKSPVKVLVLSETSLFQ